ncbi:MAG: twin-arginine translocation pathway signal protein [Armatimonadetes bacterium]|nr:twin-arginine translocation pathway signal protein [Armatimonadota bacterium]MBS1725273.1 twin-arginine translocation pathway signal protein [Armatimonadota bacterium]
MQNDDAPVGTIYTRREALTIAAKAGLGLTAGSLFSFAGASAPFQQTQPKVNLIASPELTEGPFFVDEKLDRANLLSGTSRPSVVKATPLELELLIYKLVNDKHEPLPLAQIDVWHCDAKGVYSDENHPMNHENTARQTWLRGYQLTDTHGTAKFRTIIPGWYEGRTPHIHFKIRTFSKKMQATAEFTSQFFFDEALLKKVYAKDPYRDKGMPDTHNSTDNIYADRQIDGSLAGSHMLLDLQPSKSGGYATKFTVVLTDKNFHAGRRGFGGGFPPPPGGGFGGGWESF